MNLFYEVLAGLANALTAVYRWLNGQYEVGHEAYKAPEVVFRYPTPQPLQPFVVPTPTTWIAQQALKAPSVDLFKRVHPNLVRPFVHLAGEPDPAWDIAKPLRKVNMSKPVRKVRAVARVVARASMASEVDELGLPRKDMADTWATGVGIFEQTLAVWKRTGRLDDLSWA